MMERFESFLNLSVALTGFSQIELRGTGMVNDYLGALEATLPVGVCDELLTAWGALSAGADDDLAVRQILGDSKLGPVAQNLIVLWYCGTWTALPDAWRSAYGVSPLDMKRVISAEAYQAGLQWVVAGAHPPGSGQQGFAAWSMPPDGSSR